MEHLANLVRRDLPADAIKAITYTMAGEYVDKVRIELNERFVLDHRAFEQLAIIYQSNDVKLHFDYQAHRHEGIVAEIIITLG